MSMVTSLTLAAAFSILPAEPTDTSKQTNKTEHQKVQICVQDQDQDKIVVAFQDPTLNCVDAPQSQLKWIASIT